MSIYIAIVGSKIKMQLIVSVDRCVFQVSTKLDSFSGLHFLDHFSAALIRFISVAEKMQFAKKLSELRLICF